MSVSSSRRQFTKFRCNSCLVALKIFESSTVNMSGNRAHVAKQFFTNCYHVLCNNCRIKSGQNCAACKRLCQFMGCTKDMQKYYRLYFEPVSSAKKHLMSVMKFQRLQHCVISKGFAAKTLYFQKKDDVIRKKEIEGEKRRRFIAEKLRKYRVIHRKIGQEKRRREEEKKRRDAEKRRWQKELEIKKYKLRHQHDQFKGQPAHVSHPHRHHSQSNNNLQHQHILSSVVFTSSISSESNQANQTVRTFGSKF